MVSIMLEQIIKTLTEIKKVKPLVLNITNYVTMDFMANALLAMAAAPIMTVCDEELEELVKIANCININIGTLEESFIKRCYKILDLAKLYKKPLILDPVGSGASLIRTKTAKIIMEHADIVRGNASEIISLQDESSLTFGVESIHSTAQAKDIAIELSRKYGFTVVVSGQVDFITNGKKEAEIPFGSPFMPLVTGMGCTLTAIISVFRGVLNDSFESAQLATIYFGLCGQLAEQQARYPGTFRTAFIDQLYEANFVKMRRLYEK